MTEKSGGSNSVLHAIITRTSTLFLFVGLALLILAPFDKVVLPNATVELSSSLFEKGIKVFLGLAFIGGGSYLQLRELKTSAHQNCKPTAPKLVSETDRLEDLEQEQEFPNFHSVIDFIHKAIEQGLKECEDKRSDKPVTVRFITVGMTHSKFLIQRIPKLMDNYRHANLHLEITIIDPEFFEGRYPEIFHCSLPLMADESRNRVRELKDFAEKHGDFEGRLQIHLKTYKNFPHWHGMLVESGVLSVKKYLFLGRTRWEFGKKVKCQIDLEVGVNLYRFFKNTSEPGLHRIALFENWHRFYFEYAGGERFRLKGNTFSPISKI